MEKINIAELLKDCPKGMELDCTMYDNLEFDYIDENSKFPIRCRSKITNVGYNSHNFTEYGEHDCHSNAKCVIFPKGKTTWKGFVPPYKFKDGDVCCIKTKEFKHIFIFKVSEDYNYIFKYANLSRNNLYTDKSAVCTTDSVKEIRLATEEEKQKLFDAIKANGYKWNAETKTLEKLPKFKVGDRVKHLSAYTSGIIVKVDDKGYHIDYPKGKGVCYISFTLEKDYELVPKKFDISTLKPFESRVLVRNDINQLWIPAFWGYKRDNGYATTFGWSQYCIPYEGNEHLLNTANDCDNFFKVWEK